MNLPDYLKAIGDEAAARKFSVSERCIASWRLRQRLPRPAKAQRIVEATDGLVTLAEIYGPHPEAANDNKH
jgi:hypothetical protein